MIYSSLTANNSTYFFILTFLAVENILVLWYHFFSIRQEKLNKYNLTNLYFNIKSINPMQKYQHI